MHSHIRQIWSIFFIGFLFLAFGRYTLADSMGWQCKDTPDGKRCLHLMVPTGEGYFTSLRNCLKGTNNENDFLVPTVNPCVVDPRHVLRHFPPLDYWDIGRALNLLIPLATIFGALISGGFLLYGAYIYTTAQGDSKKITDAIHTITWAVVGLVFVVFAYALVRTILYLTNTNFGL